MCVCTLIYFLGLISIFRYSEEHKLPSSLEKREYSDCIKDAERQVIRTGNYDIGLLRFLFVKI